MCGACAVDHMLDQPEWLAWVEAQGYDTVDAFVNYDKYLRIFKRTAPDHLPRIVTVAEYPALPTMCERCLVFFPYDRRYGHLNHEEYGNLQLAQAWQSRHDEAMNDPLAVEEMHRNLLVSATHLLNSYVEIIEIYGEGADTPPVAVEMLSALTSMCRSGIAMLQHNTGRLDAPTLDKHYRDIAADAGIPANRI